MIDLRKILDFTEEFDYCEAEELKTKYEILIDSNEEIHLTNEQEDELNRNLNKFNRHRFLAEQYYDELLEYEEIFHGEFLGETFQYPIRLCKEIVNLINEIKSLRN